MNGLHRKIRFHSISFPSEWGGVYRPHLLHRDGNRTSQGVSIQLVSPASGEQWGDCTRPMCC